MHMPQIYQLRIISISELEGSQWVIVDQYPPPISSKVTYRMVGTDIISLAIKYLEGGKRGGGEFGPTP